MIWKTKFLTFWHLFITTKRSKSSEESSRKNKTLGGKRDFINGDEVAKFPYLKVVIKETWAQKKRKSYS